MMTLSSFEMNRVSFMFVLLVKECLFYLHQSGICSLNEVIYAWFTKCEECRVIDNSGNCDSATNLLL